MFESGDLMLGLHYYTIYEWGCTVNSRYKIAGCLTLVSLLSLQLIIVINEMTLFHETFKSAFDISLITLSDGLSYSTYQFIRQVSNWITRTLEIDRIDDVVVGGNAVASSKRLLWSRLMTAICNKMTLFVYLIHFHANVFNLLQSVLLWCIR